MSFFSKINAAIDKGTAKIDKVAHHARDEIIGRWNPNRRHDDPHEIEADQIREEINKSHRFESFADIREGNFVKWHIDGHDYMWALSELIANAQEFIFILDWWLTPELYLRRPPAYHPEWRLDRLLLKKAQQGVKIHIVVYKEVTQTMSMSSSHTKNYLEKLHENIMVFRHPDHVGSKDSVEFWSHHEKVVVVDNHLACIGGLDLCFGRWDTHNHPLADIHPTDFAKTLFPGQDYNNARVMDFKEVKDYASNTLNGLETARMPWHDVHMTLTGPVVLDISQHFIERWNEVKKRKYRADERYPWLSLPHNVEALPNESVARHPHLEQWREIGHQYKQRWHRRYYGGPAPDDDSEYGEETDRYHPRPSPATCRVQVVRSVSDWSHGVLKERSIQNAYIKLIEEAEHFIYIENQFFISATQPGGQVTNLIAQALVQRVVRAAKEGRKFKVIINIPEVPGFAGNVKDESSLKIIMAAQYRTINRGGQSIYEELRKEGLEPTDWVRIYHLRGYDRINAPIGSLIRQMEENSHVSFHQAQVALAKEWIGDDQTTDQKTVTLALANPQAADAGLGLGVGGVGGSTSVGGQTEAEKAEASGVKSSELKKDKDKDKNTITVDLPATAEEARQIVAQFEAGSIPIRDDENVKDSLSFHSNLAGQSARSFGGGAEEVRGFEGYGEEGIEGELWVASEAEELNAYVSELRYIHSKVMIVDDRRVIMGSANINDRSQKGDGDSEIALVVEDQDMIESYMNGEYYQAGRFAATLRRKLFREHLGLIPPQHCLSSDDPVTSFMRPAPHPNADETRTRWDDMVSDPLGKEFEALWTETARKNREVFTELFRVVPTNLVRDWKGWETYIPKDTKLGHVVPGIPLDRVKKLLSQVRGGLVECPLDFLIDDKDFVNGAEWRGLNPTLPIYI